MTVYNLGSINIDLVFRVPHIPRPGETLLSSGMTRGLGGKGANTSVAIAKSGATVCHYGAIGQDGDAELKVLETYGVDCTGVVRLNGPTGQAIIHLSDDGENAITLLKGANWEFPQSIVDNLMPTTRSGDWFVFQNETCHIAHAAEQAKKHGLKVAYAAAPFDAMVTQSILKHVDLLALNEIEAAQLSDSTGMKIQDLSPKMVLVTQGSAGATLYIDGEKQIFQPATPVDNVQDTTAAGDTFFGYFLGGLSSGTSVETSLQIASVAAAMSVTKFGAAEAIPTLKEVLAFQAIV